MKLSYSSSELASSMFFSVHQSIFFLRMFVPEGVQTMFLFLSKTSIFPFLFSVLIPHNFLFQIYLPPAFPFPMLTSVSRGRRRDSLRSNRPSHSLLDTLPYYCWLPQPIPTSSPDISSTLHTGHTNHPAATPPPNKIPSPDRRARTAQQSTHHQPTPHHLPNIGCRKELSLATSETKNSTDHAAAAAVANIVHVAKVCASRAAVPVLQPSLVDESPCTVVANSRSLLSSLPRATGQHFLGGLTPRCVSPSKRLKV